MLTGLPPFDINRTACYKDVEPGREEVQVYPVDTLWALGQERTRDRMRAAARHRKAAAATTNSVPETGERSPLVARRASGTHAAVASGDPCATC